MQSEHPMQQNMIIVEVMLEDRVAAEAADKAFAEKMGSEVVSQLKQEGYTIALPETTRKGGELVVLAGYVVNEIWQHRQEIEQAINVSTSLYTVYQAVAGICRSILRSHKKLDTDGASCKITIVIDDASMTIETKNVPENDAALALAQRFAELHPAVAKRAGPHSKVHVQNRLPNRTSRKSKGQR